jgi:hypothetical protein
LFWSDVKKRGGETSVQKAMVLRAARLAALAILGLSSIGLRADRTSDSPPAEETKMKQIGRSQLCVTEGVVEKEKEQGLSVNVTKMRAFVAEQTAQTVEAHFKYVGGTAKSSALASGQMRRQFGLKLRAQDGCNVVYAMWRFEPKSEIVVSVKSNPEMHESSECGNRGYHNIKPRRSSAVPAIKAGSAHTLRAELNGREMKVTVDGAAAWEGDVGAEALAFDGPVGMRSDNVDLELELFAGQPDSKRNFKIPPCRAASE